MGENLLEMLMFIVCQQRAMHAEHDIFQQFRPSVHSLPVLCLNECTFCH